MLLKYLIYHKGTRENKGDILPLDGSTCGSRIFFAGAGGLLKNRGVNISAVHTTILFDSDSFKRVSY